MKSYHKTHKKKSKHIFDPPLPGTSWTFQEKIRRKYEGEFIGFGVWIKDKVQALDIFDSGFFGKGVLSRSKPQWAPPGSQPPPPPRKRYRKDGPIKEKKIKRTDGFHYKSLMLQNNINNNNNNNNNNANSNQTISTTTTVTSNTSNQTLAEILSQPVSNINSMNLDSTITNTNEEEEVEEEEESNENNEKVYSVEEKDEEQETRTHTTMDLMEEKETEEKEEELKQQAASNPFFASSKSKQLQQQQQSLGKRNAQSSDQSDSQQPQKRRKLEEGQQQQQQQSNQKQSDQQFQKSLEEEFPDLELEAEWDYLQLGFEEAFFLSSALNVLQVSFNGRTLSESEFWNLCCEHRPGFCFSYSVYHYYRTSNFVPKYGIKYGVDFILYEKGPAFYHAARSVVISVIDDAGEKAISNVTSRSLAFINLLNLNRVSEHVRKGLVICFVLKPNSFSEKYSNEVKSIKEIVCKLSIRTVDVLRWLPDKNRDLGDDQDD